MARREKHKVITPADSGKTREQLISELEAARKQIRILESGKTTDFTDTAALEAGTMVPPANHGPRGDVERFFRATIDASPANIALLDRFGTIRMVNAAWREFALANGAHPDSVSEGVNYLDVCDKACCCADKQLFVHIRTLVEGLRTLLSGQEYQYNAEYECSSPKAARWFEVRATRFVMGQESYIIVSHENITERKRADQSLKLLASRLIAAQEIAQVGDWEWIVEEDKVTWSDQMFTILGLDSAEQVPTYEENLLLYHNEDAQRLKASVSRILDDGTPYDLELRRTKPNGSEICVQARGVAERDAKGKVIRLYGSVQDITARKRSEQALAQSEARFRTIFDSVGDCIFIHDSADGSILDVNSSACAKYGYSRDEFRQLDMQCLSSGVPPYTQEDALKNLKMACQGQVQPFEWQAKTKDGRIFWVLVSMSRATIGMTERILVSVQDITTQKMAEQQLIQSNEMFQCVLNTIPQHICWKDIESRFLGCNMNYAQLVGFADPLEIVGKTDWDLPWKKEETEFFLSCDRRVMDSDTPEYHIIEPAT